MTFWYFYVCQQQQQGNTLVQSCSFLAPVCHGSSTVATRLHWCKNQNRWNSFEPLNGRTFYCKFKCNHNEWHFSTRKCSKNTQGTGWVFQRFSSSCAPGSQNPTEVCPSAGVARGHLSLGLSDNNKNPNKNLLRVVGADRPQYHILIPDQRSRIIHQD